MHQYYDVFNWWFELAFGAELNNWLYKIIAESPYACFNVFFPSLSVHVVYGDVCLNQRYPRFRNITARGMLILVPTTL